MRAHAAVVAEPAGDGCVFSTLRSDPPLLLRPTPSGLYLQGGAAGPLGGDQLRLDVHVAAGARLTIRSVAAMIVLPGHGPSSLHVAVRVDEGGHLDWCPEPLVSVIGSRHHQRAEIDAAQGATLRWNERLVLGRSDEPSGGVETGLRVERDATALFHQDLRVGDPDEPETWRNPAVIGDGRAVGTELRVGSGISAQTVRHDRVTGARASWVALADDVWLCQGVGRRMADVDAMMR